MVFIDTSIPLRPLRGHLPNFLGEEITRAPHGGVYSSSVAPPRPSLTFTAAALQRAILGLVDPPGVEGDRRILGDLLGPREAVPVGHHLLAEAELRDDEQVPLQHAVQA